MSVQILNENGRILLSELPFNNCKHVIRSIKVPYWILVLNLML